MVTHFWAWHLCWQVVDSLGAIATISTQTAQTPSYPGIPSKSEPIPMWSTPAISRMCSMCSGKYLCVLTRQLIRIIYSNWSIAQSILLLEMIFINSANNHNYTVHIVGILTNDLLHSASTLCAAPLITVLFVAISKHWDKWYHYHTTIGRL